jgi:hypothetical protein
MKKILLSLGVVLTSISLNAQIDTLTQTFATADSIQLYQTAANSYVFGNNTYGDLAKAQKFDASMGVSATGLIYKALLGIPVKNGSTGNVIVTVWDDASGKPGNIIGSKSITVASIDTSVAAFATAGGFALYNTSVTFDTPIAIPANKIFYLGVQLPAAPTVIGMLSTTKLDFSSAVTHSFEQWSDNSWNNMGDAWATGGGAVKFNSAAAIFPVVYFNTGLGINEEVENSLSVYPNPANDVLNVSINGTIETVSVISMDGKVVATSLVNNSSASVNVADLKAGVYFYEVKTAKGATVRNTFVKQ